MTGGIIGAVLLLVLPASAFDAIVPVLILLAVVLVILGPPLSRLVAKRDHAPAHGGGAALVAMFPCGVYGGYFGAAQGVLLMAFLGILLDDQHAAAQRGQERPRRAGELVAAIVFVLFSAVAWDAAAVIAVGSTSADSSAACTAGGSRRPCCAA